MRTTVLLVALTSLSGCEIIENTKDLIGDLTNPLVTQALVLGVTPPDSGDVTIPAEFADGAGATVFLADAADVGDMASAPVEGADVALQEQAFSAGAPGAYLLEPGALSYASGQTWTLTVGIGDSTATADIELPGAASFDVPAAHPPGSDLVIDLTGQEFDGALIVVVNQDGDLVYDNRPEDIMGLYELTRGDPVGAETIPGDTFSAQGAYAIGVAGIKTTTGREALESMNTVLSTMMAGNMVFEPMAVVAQQ